MAMCVDTRQSLSSKGCFGVPRQRLHVMNVTSGWPGKAKGYVSLIA